MGSAFVKTVIALFLVLIVVPSTVQAQDICTDSLVLLRLEHYRDAERQARKCLEAMPDEAAVWVLLSKSLAAQGKYSEALEWANKAADKHPRDKDIAAWQIRVMAWMGMLEEADDKAAMLGPKALEDSDTALLVANIAFWQEHWRIAAIRYSAYLERWPDDVVALRNRGICYEKIERPDLAKRDLRRLCQLDEEVGCPIYEMNKRHRARYSLFVQPGYMLVENRPDGWNVYGLFTARVWRTLLLGLSSDYRNRDYATGSLSDVYTELSAFYKWRSGWRLYGAGGFTIDPDFSPTWTAQIEPGYMFKSIKLEVLLKYWRIQFENSGTHVIAPAFNYYVGPVLWHTRYYLSIDDDGDVGNSLFTKLTYSIGPVGLSVGGGVGDKTEYIEPRQQELDFYWLVLGGVAWQINWRHKLSADYVYRNEKAGSQHYKHHQFMLGYQVKF